MSHRTLPPTTHGAGVPASATTMAPPPRTAAPPPSGNEPLSGSGSRSGSGPLPGMEPPSGSGPPSIWPRSAAPLGQDDLAVGGVPLTEIADRFGTPAYVLDEDEVRHRCRAYLRAFPDADVCYAAKAFLCRAMVHWVHEEGLGLDVCSAGELELAVTTGFPPERIVLHGNAKSPADLRAALRLGVGRIVIDSTSEIARLAAAVPAGSRQQVLVRVVPGIAAGGHAKIRTGTDDQKFGLSIADGSAQHAIARILSQPRLELVGLHCHLGSQITTVKPYLSAVRRLIGLLARIQRAARRHPARAGPRGRPRHRLPPRRARPRPPLPRHQDPRRTGRRLRGGRAAGAPARGRTRPRDRGPGRCRPLPGAGRQTDRCAHLRGGGRRDERQPAARAVRGRAMRPG